MISFEHNKKLTVINLYGGPSSGKSVTALLLAGLMQAGGFKTEYVHEYAKTQVWDKRMNETLGIFTEQDYIGAQQHNMIRRLVEHDIDYVVTDTSLLLGLAYMPDWYPKSYPQFLLDVFNSYNNLNVFVDRGNIPYVEAGRNQTREEAIEKDYQIKGLLESNKIPYITLVQDVNQAPDTLAREIIKLLK